jgi:hypothetical protein
MFTMPPHTMASALGDVAATRVRDGKPGLGSDQVVTGVYVVYSGDPCSV